MVPLAHHLEIPRAGVERRAGAPAVHLQQIGGRGKHIRHGMAQIDATVSVEIYSVFDVGGWQELGLPDLGRRTPDRLWHSGRLRVARHGGKEAVKVPAALRRPRWRGEEQHEEQCCKRTLHHGPSFTIPFVPAQAQRPQFLNPTDVRFRGP